MSSYRLLVANHVTPPGVDVGSTVYDCLMCCYGCAEDDTSETGIEHIAVTADPAGGYPFFTVPRHAVMPLS